MKKLFIFFTLLFSAPIFLNAQSPNDFEENFNDNSRGWFEGDDKSSFAKVQNGQYILEHKLESGSYMFFKEINLDPEKDFYIEAKMTQLKGVDNNGYGIVFGMKDTKNCYSYVVSSNKMYSLYGFNKNIYFSSQEWTNSENINGMKTANILAIKKTGNIVSYYLNGNELFSKPYESFFGNSIGFVLNWKMKVSVDYIKVKQMNSVSTNANTITSFTIEYSAPTKKIKISDGYIWLTEVKEEYNNPVSSVPSRRTEVTKKAKLSDDVIKNLSGLINSNGFMNLKSEYGAAPGDRFYPYSINVKTTGKEKSVLYKSNPSAEGSPKEFSEIESALNKIVSEISTWEE